MSLRHFYRPNWVPGDAAVEFTDSVRLYTFDMAENAEEGSVATSRYVVDDPEGVLDFPPLTRIWSTETEVASSSNTYVHHGYIADRTIKRGTSTLVSAARVIEVSVADENSVLSRRVLSNTNANRPAETDVARVLWLANEADGQLLIDDTQFLSTASPVSMDAVDYRGQTGLDVLSDCAQASGKNFWAYFNQNLGTGLWYGAEDLAVYDSSIRLTNVAGEVDEANDVYAIGDGEATQLVRDPSRLVSSVYLQWASGATYVRNQAMFNQIGLRDQVMSSLNVKTQAKATARANRYLADLDTEDDRITTTVLLPASKVTWLKAGMRVRFKASHLPGYESEVWLRVYRCSVAQVSEEKYLLTLEMGTNSIPASAADSITSLISFEGHIGSAAFLGTPSDVEDDYSSSHGQTATLTVGRQYRIVFTSISCRVTDPAREFDQINGFNCRIFLPTATATAITQGNGYDWTPDDGTQTASLTYEGIGWSCRSPIRSGGTAPNNMYGNGQIITGEWLTYDGPTTSVDLAMRGIALSGFYGFELSGRVELQERRV